MGTGSKKQVPEDLAVFTRNFALHIRVEDDENAGCLLSHGSHVSLDSEPEPESTPSTKPLLSGVLFVQRQARGWEECSELGLICHM